MIIIYGLGNSGLQYVLNKHNVGHMILDNIVNKSSLTWNKVSGGFCCKISEEIIGFKSNAFMNNSGMNLNNFISYQKFQKEHLQLIVIQDDSDQIVGSAKLVVGGGTAGHRGIADVYNYSNSIGVEKNNIWRLKVGIRPMGNTLKSETFVLTNISAQEKEILFSLCNDLLNYTEKSKQINFINLQQIINSKYVPSKTN